MEFEVTGCEGENNVIRFLEHIQLYVAISYTSRGALNINITSPHGRIEQCVCISREITSDLGTQTTLLSAREQDKSPEGFIDWPFMSVHNWGENPKGVWTIKIADNV